MQDFFCDPVVAAFLQVRRLMPVLLAITGITVWLVKWRGRAARKKLDNASAADEPAPAI